MQCPVCDAPLREIEKYEVRVDICPGCKGVWLDRGELEKILEMVASDQAAHERKRDPASEERTHSRERRENHDRDEKSDRYRDREYSDRDHHHESKLNHGHPKKRGSWLSEIFEGFGGD